MFQHYAHLMKHKEKLCISKAVLENNVYVMQIFIICIFTWYYYNN